MTSLPLARSVVPGRPTVGQPGFSRRVFLQGSGLLLVSFGVGRVLGDAGRLLAQGINGAGSDELDAWLAIARDGRVTVYTGKCELGQGLFTAQTQLVAEELSVPFDRITLIQCDTALTPDQGTTSGAQSHPANFNESNLALAAATAREALLRMAADRLGTSEADLRIDAGIVQHEPSDRRVSYGELIGSQRFELTLDRAARRKAKHAWTLLGTSVPRVELPEMVTGRFEYVHNVKVPGMAHGRVVRPPVVGARVESVDESSVAGVPGLVGVVVKHDFVGVVAEKPHQAVRAARQLRVRWSPGTGLPLQVDYHDQLRGDPAVRDTRAVDSGDVEARLAAASTVVEATYRYPYQMHGSLGSSCAVADVRGNRATIWSPSQAVFPHRNTAAMLLGLDPENVHVIFKMGSGCYGINGAETVSYDAALLSQAVGRPVRVQLSRQDEMAWENYGYAFHVEQRVGLDPDGSIVAWDYQDWSPTRGGRPGYGTPGNVVTGFLAGFPPAAFSPRSPAPAPQRYGNNRNNVPSYVAGRVGGEGSGTGTVESERVVSHQAESPLWTGPLRAPWRLQNTFAQESFMDEVAARVGADPVEYRLRHLRDPRLREVVGAATQRAGWQPRPSPAAGGTSGEWLRGRGIACVLYEGDNGYCAMVVEVEVSRTSGTVKVPRIVVALDCGPVSNPDGARNQVEGGALQGLSRALLEEVTWDEEKVTSVDWRTYPSLTLGFEAPRIETVLVDREGVPATGAGETAVTVSAAALGNAIFDATGVRLRQVPFRPERVLAALRAGRA